ncbi:hypothetical protein AAMO2058_001162900 [Amorphochlora amoebiformis]
MMYNALPHSPVFYCQEMLNLVHLTADVPWWVAIGGMTIVIRILFTPIVIATQRNTARMTNARPEIQRITDEMNELKASGNFGLQKQQEYIAKQQEIMRKHGAEFSKMLYPFIQMPVFMSFFFATRSLHERFPDVTSGGYAWFMDLSQPDPYYLLPIFSAFSMLITLEIGSMGQPASQMSNKMRWLMRGFMVVIVPMTASFPAATHSYWVSSNLLSLIQTAILKIPPIRKFLNIPKILTEKEIEAMKFVRPKVVKPVTFSKDPTKTTKRRPRS